MKVKNHHGLSEKEMELAKLLMAECETTGDIQEKLKRLFAGTIEQMLEAEMDEQFAIFFRVKSAKLNILSKYLLKIFNSVFLTNFKFYS